jgi:hypothetical protein
MFSFYHEERTAPPYLELKAEVRRIFDLIQAGMYEPYTSIFATNEIDDTEDLKKRDKMWDIINDFGITILETSPKVKRLTDLYLRAGVVSSAWATDAAHIAITTVNSLDFIVSLNFTHIARPWTVEHVRLVNMREGYNPIGIYKPAEVLEIYEDSTRIHE